MIDPVLVEVLRARLDGIVREMQQALFRTGYSTAVRESHDASCAMLDAEGQVIAQHTVLPLHLGAFPACVQGVFRHYTRDELAAGEVFVINHPYEGGSPHALDVAVLAPVRFQGVLVGFAGSIAHKPDIGGSVPGSGSGKAQEIYHEGIHLPAVRWSPEMERVFAANSRTPELVSGDVRGQIGATRLGEHRLLTLLAETGLEAFGAATQALAERTLRAVRRAVAGWPDGVYRAEGQIDDDGITLGHPVTIRLAVEISGDRIRFDWSGSDPQTRGPSNIRPPLVRAVCYYCLKALIDPDLPVNRGIAEAVETVFRPGTILDPRLPAPVSSYMATAQICTEVVLRALGPVAGARRIAESGGTGGIVLGWASGSVQYELFGSALGARAGLDGVNAIAVHVGNSRATPIEILESEFPVRLRRFELRADSGGTGRWRGGLGIVREYELLDNARLSTRMDRHTTRPRGLDGGQPGRPGALIVNPGTDMERRLPARSGDVEVRAGDILRLERAGGGGMGDPAQRDPAALEADLLDGYVTPEGAARDYGYRPAEMGARERTPLRDKEHRP
jgi:N-methylhydantoinase B